MPNVILIGGSNTLYQMLKNDSRWRVLRVMHGDPSEAAASISVLGDPRNWDLVIDDCAHAEIVAREAEALVSDQYLDEAKRARGLLFGFDQHDAWRTVPPNGHHDFEANSANAAPAIHLVDFFDEFEASFLNRALVTNYLNTSKPPIGLIANSYGQGLAVLDRSYVLSERLIVIDVDRDETRQKAFEYLLYRTVPKLWPEVYSDQFRPRRVLELERIREQEIADRRTRVRELDAAITAEVAYFAAYAPLTLLADDPLKALVARALAEVFEFEVIDLDKRTKEGEPKTLDLLARRGESNTFVEVRSAGNRAARIGTDIEPLDDHAETVTQTYGQAAGKVLVFNGMYRRPSEQRTEGLLFSNQVADEARERGITLLSTQRLLEAIAAHRNGELGTDAFAASLTQPGVFVPPWVPS